MNEKIRNDEDKEAHFSWHAVAWIDLLGQTDELEQLNFIPTTPKEREKFIEIARRTSGRIRRFREELRNLCSLLSGEGQPKSYDPRWDESLRKMWDRHMSPKLGIEFISDAALLKVSLQETEDSTPLSSVAALCDLLQIVMLAQLAGKLPIRGGLDAGVCSDVEPGSLYGAAVAKAYRLESKCAKYPRIVVGQHFLGYLPYCKNTLLPAAQRGEKELLASLLAQIERKIVKDVDGQYVLNYLQEEGIPADQYQQCVKGAVDLIKSEIGAHSRHREKYLMMKDFFSKMGKWV